MAKNEELPDELNPDLMFQLTHSALLLQAIRGEIDLLALAREEMACRGLGENGEWVGFRQAYKIWGVEGDDHGAN